MPLTIEKPAQPHALEIAAEASDVLTETPRWAVRGLLYIIIAIISTALLWAHFSRIDVVAEARGTVIPEGYVRSVQSLANGIVQYVLIREGTPVKQGQILFQFDAKELRTKAEKLREELATNEEQFRQLLAGKGAVGETLEKQNRVTRLKEEIAAAELSLSQTIIAAPISGIVTKLDVRAPGAVVRTGQQVAAIAPAGARLVIEAMVRNKDITLVEAGMPAKLKLDAFPFQDYGTLPGKVIEVSPDAQVDEKTGSFYKVLIAAREDGTASFKKSITLRPGLALTAEIITERKSVLAIILEPFRKLRAEMMRGA